MADSKLSTPSSHSSGLQANTTSRGFSDLRRNGTFTDVVLKVGSTKYPAHKVILSANSPVFQKMFSENWKEKSEDCIELHETPECEEVFGILVDYLYQCTNGTEPLNRDNVQAVVSLADKYEVTSVTELCCKFIETLIGGDDMIKEVFHWLSFAEKAQLQSVIKCCYDTICWNVKKAASLAEWKALTSEQLLSILKRNDAIVEDEYSVFSAAFDWLASNDTLSESCVKEIVSCIEFRNMDSDQLIDVDNKFQTLEILSACQCYVNEAIAFRNLEDGSGKLAIAVHRRYLNVVEMKKALATHMNSAMLDITWPLSGNSMSLVQRVFSFQLSCSYSSDNKELFFKICAFKVPADTPAHYGLPGGFKGSLGSSGLGTGGLFGSGLGVAPLPVTANQENSHRISGHIFLVTKSLSLIQHILPCNKVVKNIDTFQDGDAIVEFPGIRCVNIGQFDGHYLGKFNIFYKIVVKPHTSVKK